MLEITFQFLELWTEILPYIDRQKVALDITKCKQEICEVKKSNEGGHVCCHPRTLYSVLQDKFPPARKSIYMVISKDKDH